MNIICLIGCMPFRTLAGQVSFHLCPPFFEGSGLETGGISSGFYSMK